MIIYFLHSILNNQKIVSLAPSSFFYRVVSVYTYSYSYAAEAICAILDMVWIHWYQKLIWFSKMETGEMKVSTSYIVHTHVTYLDSQSCYSNSLAFGYNSVIKHNRLAIKLLLLTKHKLNSQLLTCNIT